jgi:hypothetical protein
MPPATWYESAVVAAATLRGWAAVVAGGRALSDVERAVLARDLRGAAAVLNESAAAERPPAEPADGVPGLTPLRARTAAAADVLAAMLPDLDPAERQRVAGRVASTALAADPRSPAGDRVRGMLDGYAGGLGDATQTVRSMAAEQITTDTGLHPPTLERVIRTLTAAAGRARGLAARQGGGGP